jgi:exonuclease SbcC
MRALNEQEQLRAATTAELGDCEQEYSRLAQHQSGLVRLLDQIEVHIQDGVCPTCGVNHYTKARLLERIHAQKEARPVHIEEIAERCRRLRGSLEEIDDRLASLGREVEALRKAQEDMSRKLADGRRVVAEFEQLLSQAGLMVSGPDLLNTLNSSLAKETAIQAETQARLRELNQEEERIDAAIRELRRSQGEKRADGDRISAAIVAYEKQIETLRSDARKMSFSLDMSVADHASETQKWTSVKPQAELRIRELTAQRDAYQREMAQIDALHNDAAKRADAVRAEVDMLDQQIGDYLGLARGLLLPDDLDLRRISEERERVVRSKDTLERLLLKALTLERALEASLRSAERSKLDHEAQATQQGISAAEAELRQIDEATRWFTRAKDILERENSEAIRNHVRAYGPLATLLQQRLRPVYGFGGVRLDPVSDEIRVLVDWGGRELKPTDYFSDSQKQILMLCLFLSGRLTQTWSGFSPILLDDPVTHFDDLNAYGFVELVRGIISSSPGRRQFFISTCEERLFELMRQKLRSSRNEARFYRFEAITSDGPIVTSVD